MTTDDLLRKAQEALKADQEARERLSIIRKLAIARTNKLLAIIADKKTIISFEEESE